MDYETFLTRVIDDGIAAAKADYCRPDQSHKLEGAVAGFEACRGLAPAQLAEVLTAAHAKQNEAFRDRESPDHLRTYWRLACFTAEVEWTCNCVSALMLNEGAETIVPVTARGMMKAAEIVGVAQPV